jgi:hypothetical protein
MTPIEDWERLRQPRAGRNAPGISPIRIALLFGSVAVAFALLAVSFLGDSRGAEYFNALRATGVDTITTGSINGTKTYTIRKSVLQSSPGAACVIQQDGTSTGEC